MSPDKLRSRAGVVVRESSAEDLDDILRAVLSATDYGFLLTDLNHVAIACNQEFGRLFSVDIEKVVRQDADEVRRMVVDRIPDPEVWTQNLQEVYADPMGVQVDELVLKSPNCRLRRSTGPVISREGTSIGRLWTFLDITAEARLRKMRETLAEAGIFFHPEPRKVYGYLVDVIGDYYGSVTLLSVREGDFMRFQAIGGPNEEVKSIPGNNLADSYCQFCLQSQTPLIIQNAKDHDVYSKTLPAQMGLTRYAGVPIMAPGGEVVGTLCILDDRSDEPLDYEDLRFLNLFALRISYELDRENQLRSLEGDLAATDKALKGTQHRLIQSEKLAVTGMLSASISHDIRNILSAIAMESSILADKPHELVKVIQTQLDRFAVLSHRLLSYAKPDEASVVPVDLVEVVAVTLELLQGHLKVSDIRVVNTLPEELPSVLGDPVRLEHLFVNLLLNAIQASQTGTQIEIRGEASKERVVIEFEDSGKGMSHQQLAKLFEPFSSTRHGGFGLGLYSCKQIVQEAGGDICARSKPGLGTTFQITLPLAP